jgi:hypothetical protein
LATSDEAITKDVYGEPFEMEAAGGTWQHRGLAVFLFQVANLAVLHNVGNNYPNLPDPSGYFIVLQARTCPGETAHKFYRHIGFEECGFFDMDDELSANVFHEFPWVIDESSRSVNDYIHFIRDLKVNPDLAIFRNSTGTFFENETRMRLTSRFNSLNFNSDDESFTWPFSAIRDHLMLLCSGLGTLFFPFSKGTRMFDYIKPNTLINQHQSGQVDPRDREILSSRTDYVNDTIVDFYGRW